eukprot:s1106_g12.t1
MSGFAVSGTAVSQQAVSVQSGWKRACERNEAVIQQRPDSDDELANALRAMRRLRQNSLERLRAQRDEFSCKVNPAIHVVVAG